MTKILVRNHSHWGAFNAVVEDGRVVGVTPFELDPDPSRLIEAIPAAVHSEMRVARPMVREGWLARGPGSGAGRGRERFVPVKWERALDLVAGEIKRVRREHGDTAIMGGSQGWSSAGLFHEARVQLPRFLAAGGGFVGCATTVPARSQTGLVEIERWTGAAPPVKAFAPPRTAEISA
ncbi:MAG TPA: molybdopterin-dependent oxidoreductase [Stellaceae bacterium]|nr:molybdopterin-dependent oxidoreductase [Stellaceae bacterium]